MAGRDADIPGARNGFKGQVDNAFRTGYGTVLFFEDQAVLDEWSGKMPNYSAVSFSPLPTYPSSRPIHRPQLTRQPFNGAWSDNAAGILQYVVWTALEAEGYGASLQVRPILCSLSGHRSFFYKVTG